MDDNVIKAAKTALDKCKIQLMVSPNTAFIQHICFSLQHLFDDSIPTACTNATYIKYNPEFLNSLSPEEQLFVLLHETWHVVLDHCGAVEGSRMKGRDPQKFNIACDHVINLMLKNSGVKIWPKAFADEQYQGMSSEQVYNLLPYDAAQDLPPGYMDIQAPDGSPQDASDALDDLLVQAAVAAEMAGQGVGELPSYVQERLEKLREPRLPWKKLLARYFNAMGMNDYTFQKPNRRFFPKYYLPSAYSEILGNVCMAIDMSGSVSKNEIEQFVSDVYSVIKNVKLKELNLLQFDTRVISVEPIKSKSDLLKCDLRGRGGTNLKDTLQWASANKPDVMAVFSDGWFDTNLVDPGIPILWLINDNPEFSCSIGKTIHYSIDS